jgi:MFS transporter, FSR family, fosmidomycin resistance protein
MFPRHLRFVFLASLGHLAIELCSQFLPVIYPVLVDTLGLTYTQIGALALVLSLGTSAAQPLFGYLSDRWDPRRMIALSVAWIGLMMGLVGWMNSYVLLMLTIGLGVLGSAAYHPPAATMASSHGGERRGASVSIFSVGGSVGSALSPLLITAAVARFGTRGTVVLTPVALLLSLLLFWQLGRMKPADRVRPEASAETKNGHFVFSLVLIVLCVMCLAWFQGSLRTYLPIWIESQGQSLAVGSRMLTVFLAAMGVGSLIGGTLSDRIGRWQLLGLCLGLLGPMVWFFVGATGWLQWVLIGVLGALLGATFPVSIVMAQETWPSGVGIASGLAMGLGWLPAGIGASFTGFVADRLSLEVGLRALVVPAVVGVGLVLAYAISRRRVLGKSGEPVPA